MEHIYKLFSNSALIEVVFRHIYWRFYLHKLINIKKIDHENQFYDFEKVLNKLRIIGVKNGSILIIHSSFDSLKKCSINPNEIIIKFN